jgi:hypothetical protein
VTPELVFKIILFFDPQVYLKRLSKGRLYDQESFQRKGYFWSIKPRAIPEPQFLLYLSKDGV